MKHSSLGVVFACVVGALSSRAAFAAGEPAKPCADPELPPAILERTPLPAQPAVLRIVHAGAPDHELTLAVADTPKRREIGLMCVHGLRPFAGMIFAFTSSGPQEFWMKRTLIPLDMVWVDDHGRVTTVAANVPQSTMDEADDKVARRSGTGRYVIELRAGDAARAGIRAGASLTLPELHASD